MRNSPDNPLQKKDYPSRSTCILYSGYHGTTCYIATGYYDIC